MSVLKCKMCGGDVELSADKTLGTCEYCGCTMTFPKVSDDQRAAAFNRGNHFRRTGEFDKALSVYERIVNEDDSDAEAHWCCALCRFGIEYVEDPTTYEWLPTMHRLSYDSFLEDVDYLATVEHSGGITQRQYQKDAMKIAEVQRGILATSQNEEPFDVFICYKESDENGERTVDSTLAQDIYYQLADKGYKVFFSRITLEDKVGTEYEPYIFAALNSAKVMLVIGTKPEYLNAVWVKNEWSRFIAMMKNDRSRVLLPCYHGMDPYDMPEALSVLQSYDMSKIGFIQDLIRGIEKIAKKDEPVTVVKETIVQQTAALASNTAPLLKRAFMFLEDGEWDKADDFCEQVLNQNPECAEAYLGKLMAELNVRNRGSLKFCDSPFDRKSNYEKAYKFADDELKSELKEYCNYKKYRDAKEKMKKADSEVSYKMAADYFKKIIGYRDSENKYNECLEKAEEARKETVYKSAYAHYVSDEVKMVWKAKLEFQSVSGYKDSDEMAEKCIKRYDEINAENERKRIEAEKQKEAQRIAEEKAAKKKKKITAIVMSSVAAVAAFVIVLNTLILPSYYRSILGGYIGDTIIFGKYEQDNNLSNGSEDIQWIVLAVENGKALIISKYALRAKAYNTDATDVTWETCTLRIWLNSEFYNGAFTAEEKGRIAKTTVVNNDNAEYKTKGGNDTLDKIFLLSIDEAKKYFSSDEARKCSLTQYAIVNGVNISAWWLRTPGSNKSAATCVSLDGGNVRIVGERVNFKNFAIRPAMWINLE